MATAILPKTYWDASITCHVSMADGVIFNGGERGLRHGSESWLEWTCEVEVVGAIRLSAPNARTRQSEVGDASEPPHQIQGRLQLVSAPGRRTPISRLRTDSRVPDVHDVGQPLLPIGPHDDHHVVPRTYDLALPHDPLAPRSVIEWLVFGVGDLERPNSPHEGETLNRTPEGRERDYPGRGALGRPPPARCLQIRRTPQSTVAPVSNAA